MEKIEFIVEPQMADERIDKVVAVRLGAEYSRTYAKQMIDKGLVTVNDSKVKPRYSVSSGDRVVMELSPAEDHYAEPEEISLEVLYEDASFIVLNKPAGMVVHPGSGNKKGTLVNALLFHCGKMANTGDETRPGIVHRLDKDTSGVIVAAKTERALRSISKQFLARTVKKTYIALVKGKVELDNGIVDVPLARSVMDRKKMDIDMVSGKEACTVYHVIKRYEKFTVLRLEPKTGRTHQLRVHMKHIGHPLLGDAKYGYPQGMPRQALHAESLRFSHPDTGKAMEFTAPVPEDMKKVVRDEEERIKG